MIEERLANIQEKRKKYFELYELDDFDREFISWRLSEFDAERDQLLSRKSEIEFELKDDNPKIVSYELVRSLIERFIPVATIVLRSAENPASSNHSENYNE